ncbi:MAG: signal peptidase I [Anaerolineales bacterium]
MSSMLRAFNSTQRGLFLAVLIFTILWIVFAPIQLGGSVSYIIISGDSMEPDFHVGDLVVARSSQAYRVDQRVIYQHPAIGYVFHRIIGQDGTSFILQGDNNDWLDTYHPEQDEILGKYWFGIPGAGILILALRKPLIFTLFVIVTFSIIAGLVFFPNANLGKKAKGKKKRMRKEPPTVSLKDFRLELIIGLSVLAVIAGTFSVISFRKENILTVDDNLSFKQIGDLSYTVSESDDVYDFSGVKTGDPIYPALNCVVDLKFSYAFSSPRSRENDLDHFMGDFSMNAELVDSDGWSRTFLLIPEFQFSGTRVYAQPSINICRILDQIAEKEAKTGLDYKVYSLSVLPRITLKGDLDGSAVEEEFSPEYTFDLSDSVLRVPLDSEGFTIEKEGEVLRQFEVNNLMYLFGRQIEVIKVRRVSLIVLALSILAAIYPAWALIRDWGRSDLFQVELLHSSVIIDIKGSHKKSKDLIVVDLESFADLRKLADRYGAMIMHEQDAKGHRYYLIDDGYLYQFSLVEGAPLPGQPGENGPSGRGKGG